MTIYRGWLCFLLFTAVAWGQAAKPAAPPAPPRAATAPSVTTAAGAAAVSVGPATAVITIPGLCDKPAEDKSKTATCKTVVTRAEFEQLVAAVAPTIAPPANFIESVNAPFHWPTTEPLDRLLVFVLPAVFIVEFAAVFAGRFARYAWIARLVIAVADATERNHLRDGVLEDRGVVDREGRYVIRGDDVDRAYCEAHGRADGGRRAVIGRDHQRSAEIVSGAAASLTHVA